VRTFAGGLGVISVLSLLLVLSLFRGLFSGFSGCPSCQPTLLNYNSIWTGTKISLSVACATANLLIYLFIYLRSTERSSNQAMEGNRVFLYVSMDNNSTPSKKYSGTNDVISMFVHVLSFECCAILRTFECRGSLLWTVADKLFQFKAWFGFNGI